MRRLRIRAPMVIHETVDEEVVIVNLETGNYYSLVGTGARIWGALERTATTDEIVSDLRASYGTFGETGFGEAVRRFLQELEGEGLIAIADGAAAADPAGGSDQADAPRAPGTNSSEPSPSEAPFEPPVLEKFTDMQELILLDPVHEVEEDRGWPHARSDDPGGGE